MTFTLGRFSRGLEDATAAFALNSFSGQTNIVTAHGLNRSSGHAPMVPAQSWSRSVLQHSSRGVAARFDGAIAVRIILRIRAILTLDFTLSIGCCSSWGSERSWAQKPGQVALHPRLANRRKRRITLKLF